MGDHVLFIIHKVLIIISSHNFPERIKYKCLFIQVSPLLCNSNLASCPQDLSEQNDPNKIYERLPNLQENAIKPVTV